jgi:hypothetical protein
MTYLTNVANARPMLRTSATIILAFICAAPFVLLFSGVVGYDKALASLRSRVSIILRTIARLKMKVCDVLRSTPEC